MPAKLIERRHHRRQTCLGHLPGPLVTLPERAAVVCTAIDVSRIGLAILSSVELTVGGAMALEIPNAELRFKIVTCQAANPKQWRVGLIADAGAQDVEACFRSANCLPNIDKAALAREAIAKPSKQRDGRSPRYEVDEGLLLHAKTLGTRDICELEIENISRSGILVTYTRKERVHFQVNTLVEITLDPHGKRLRRPVHGFAKVARRENEPKAENGIQPVRLGLVISEIFQEDLPAWNALMRELEAEGTLLQAG